MSDLGYKQEKRFDSCPECGHKSFEGIIEKKIEVEIDSDNPRPNSHVIVERNQSSEYAELYCSGCGEMLVDNGKYLHSE